MTYNAKKTGGGKNSGNCKEAQSIQMYPTGRDRKAMLATLEYTQQRYWEGIEAKKSNVDDGLTVSEKRTSPIEVVVGTQIQMCTSST